MMYVLKSKIVALSLLALLVTAACMPQPVAVPTGSEISTETAAATPSAEVGAASSNAEASATGDCEVGFRLYDHELLATDPVCIPENPRRIAFIDSVIAYAIALDVDSVTRSYYFDALLGDFPNLVDEAAISQMTDIGNTWEINAESLALAEPDLVITSAWWTESNEQIAGIAPTLIFDYDRATSWVQSFDAIAQLTGKTDVEAELLAGIAERQATLAEILAGKVEETTFTVVIIEAGDQLWMFNSTNFGANLAFDAGLAFPESVPSPEETPDQAAAVSISLEQLPLIDADHIFMFTNWNSGMEKELFANPVWQNFAASNPERIHYLTGEYWVRDHPISAHRVLDDLFRYVAQVDPAEVSPNPFAYTYPQPEGDASN